MSLLLPLARATRKYAAESSRAINALLTEKMPTYTSSLTDAVSKGLDEVVGGMGQLTTTLFIARQDLFDKAVQSTMDEWWESWVPIAEELGRQAFQDIYELSLEHLSTLFNFEFEVVPDDSLPIGINPDSAGSLQDGQVKKKEARDIDLPSIRVKIGEGGLDAQYERLLKSQFSTKTDPRNAIVTFGARDVARIRSEMIRQLRAGYDTTVARRALITKLVK